MKHVLSDENWLAARRELLDEEKAFQVARDKLAQKRRELGYRRVHKDYVFESENGPRTLNEIFAGNSQLLVYHFMFHPDWDEGCKSCSFWADSYNGVIAHLKARDVSLAAVSRGPLEKLLAYRKRMGWSFPWLSSGENSFNDDFNVSFTPEQIESGNAMYNYRKSRRIGEEMPGLSAFVKIGDEIFHSYSTYSRGLDPFNTAYQLLDLTPKGRDEDDLEFSMSWLRRHDDY
jgi:predicted dithiol-disulfide oxidoreductase (DUF899 family)